MSDGPRAPAATTARSVAGPTGSRVAILTWMRERVRELEAETPAAGGALRADEILVALRQPYKGAQQLEAQALGLMQDDAPGGRHRASVAELCRRQLELGHPVGTVLQHADGGAR